MTTPDLDWLDDEPASTKKPTSREVARRQEKKALARTKKREELVTLFKALDLDQRLWLKALVRNGFSVRATKKELREKNLKCPARWTLSRWATLPTYIQARDLIADMVYEGSAPTKATLLLRLDKIAEYNIEEVPEFHQGEPTGREQMRDVNAALKATEMQGKHLKMFGEEKSSAPEGPQLVVQIISAGDHSKVLDVTPGRVGVTPERPVIEGESEEVLDDQG